MIVYTFEGVKTMFVDWSDTVNVYYDELTGVISAVKTNGGVPRISYLSYVPDNPEGTLIFALRKDGNIISLFFQKTYPFAYATVIVDPNPPSPVIIIDSIAVAAPTEQGINDGIAIVSASGGVGPYIYSLDGVVYQNSNTLSNLSPGNYVVFVKSDVNPVTTGAFVIQNAGYIPPPIEPKVNDVIALQGGEISIQNAYKRVEVLSRFGKVPAILYNGDFEQWDGQNFNFWTRYGGLNFSRIQRTVTNTNGLQVPINNYAIQFNEKADASKFIRSSVIPVEKGDKLKVQYNVGKTETFIKSVNFGGGDSGERSTQTTSVYYLCKMRFKIGNYYLRNANNGTNYEWVTDVAFVGNLIENSKGDINTFLFSFDIPECPDKGDLSIDLHGFDKIQTVVVTNKNGVISSETSFLNDIKPLAFDNISVKKSSQNEDNDITGLLSITENLGFYTEKPDQIDILFGDYFVNPAGNSPLNNLYALRVGKQEIGQENVDLPYSTGWYEYGTTNKPVAFGLSLAKSILRAYQKPFRFWIGSLKLKPLAPEFSYLNTFNFEVPGQQKFNNKVFSILGGDIDLKHNKIENVKLAEIFDRPGKSTDITVPNYPGSTPPVFVQDPNGNANNSGIFTNQFTVEFS